METKMYVGNLSYGTGDGDLERLFTAYGRVESAQVIMDRDTGRSKGFGFVEYGSADDARAAITGLDGELPEGICAAHAQPVEDSGAGMVYLVRGGIWGVRLKAAADHSSWDLKNSGQWGEPYLLLADARDICFAKETSLEG